MKKTILITLLVFACTLFVQAQSIQEAKKLTDNEQYENATSVYKELILKSPSDVTLYYYYGDNLLLSDNADSAKIVFDQGSKIDSNHPLIKIGLKPAFSNRFQACSR